MDRTIQIVWARGPVSGDIRVAHGRLASVGIDSGRGRVQGCHFEVTSDTEVRLRVKLCAVRVQPGSRATRVTIGASQAPFSFFLRDVTTACPLFVPACGAVVLPARDRRSYALVAKQIEERGLTSLPQRIEAAEEESFDAAAARNRNLQCPTWLGVGRDMRIFRLSHQQSLMGPGEGDEGCWGYIEAAWHSVRTHLPETDDKPYQLTFTLGRGAACRIEMDRRIEEGCLPILRSCQYDGEVTYRLTSFATLEKHTLSERRVRGSDWRAAYANTAGQMLSKAELSELAPLVAAETGGRQEEVICCVQVEVVNGGAVPRYAWMRGARIRQSKEHAFNGATGFAAVGPDRVYAVHRLNGRPLPDEEVAVLLQPGERVTIDILVPHQPISDGRARQLAQLDIAAHLKACRTYWRGKLRRATQLQLPEKAIHERVKAGLLHCDLVTLGRNDEEDTPLLPTIGWYAPIGSESAPIIQFFDSMGWHDEARRSLEFFLERQQTNGFMQNFADYQLETGPVLWCLGEHYRYTRDKAWVRRIKPRVLKACEYLLAWRNRNKRDDLVGRGYGLQEGKVADPNDFFHSYMLNAYSYLGIARAAEMLADVAPTEGRRLQREAAAYRRDIRRAFYESLATSPVVPLDDGSWVPSAPPWTEHPGPVSLFAEGGNWFTHGAFGVRDTLIGAMHLVIGEVLKPSELGADFLLTMNQQLFTVENAGLSQPYYCRHDYIHLMRGEVKAYLKTYYNQLTALQDRDTYTFWEHYTYVGQHKTHEEAWFLMQTRWMLWKEDGDCLYLLRAIPRAWMAAGETVHIQDAASYFGHFSLRVDVSRDGNTITARIDCHDARRPRKIVVRLPHPSERRPHAVEGGRYDPSAEAVHVTPFDGTSEIALHFTE
ncbi:MAG: hypothetical protein HQ523_02175 [Lentisphaerae bacterium]|nr:hypothetical protein [Lentisphaerota bacterium]